MVVNIRVWKSCRQNLNIQITRFVQETLLSYLVVKMADSRSRVISALNFLTGEGIDYHPDDIDPMDLEALIQDYFDGNDKIIDDSSDDSYG